MENFELNGVGKRFRALAESLARDDTQAFGTLYVAASGMSRLRLPKIRSLKLENLMPVIRQDNPAPTLFLSVLKVLDNPAIQADGALVQSLDFFHGAIFQSPLQGRDALGIRAYASGLSMAMLENPECRVNWLTPETAGMLVSLAYNLWNYRDYVTNSFLVMARRVGAPEFAPSKLRGMVDMSADPLTVSQLLL
jgi:hypothetical protein